MSASDVTSSRMTFGLVSVLGTVAYAASFALCDSRHTLAPLAVAIGVAAGAAWAGFGLLIRLVVGRRGIDPWVDTCLRTQALGMAVLMPAAVANATFFAGADGLGSKPVSPVFVAVHAGILLLADALMGAHFVFASQSHGVSWPRALGAWVLGLNGLFAIVLTLLVQGRVFT